MTVFLWCTKVVWIIAWFNVWKVFGNQIGMIWVGMIWIGMVWVSVDVIWINVILNFWIFSPNLLTSKWFLRPEFFFNTVTYRVFTSTYLCTMPRWALVREIWLFPDGVEEDESIQPGNMWAYSFDVSRWVHNDAVITTSPKSSPLYFSTTL